MRAVDSPVARSTSSASLLKKLKARAGWLLLVLVLVAVVSSNLALKNAVTGTSQTGRRAFSRGRRDFKPGFKPNSVDSQTEAPRAAELLIRAVKQLQQRRRLRVSVKRQNGILIPAGGPLFLANAAALVKVLREHLHCQAPIQVAYWGQQEAIEILLSRIEVGI